GELAADGVVHQLPQESGAQSSPAQRDYNDGVPAGGGSVDSRTAVDEGLPRQSADELLDVPSMSDATMNDRNDIDGLRVRLEATPGREDWRSLESLSETPEFKDFLHRELPQNASEWLDPVGRRSFLKLMGASLALAGVSACTRQPDDEIVPYVRQPEEEVPGKPLFFATAMPMSGAGIARLVESHEGRPTKIEGNPDQPSSRGATDLFAQASILGLYDPDRSRNITNLGDIEPFSGFVVAMRSVLAAQLSKKGAGFRILTETI